ncbi:glutamine amidotransferase [Paracoccus aestuariivivens]|uniref:Glutamine amidotransferase n=1 Tax=Paracoccus aestuariivivens TaxID=1820333 RepID=A0A6L6JA02_9RHOB|nr:glutamine amidotransferase [Paracoccus aestuariivivens]MTH78376.1 glutamine amidotransferase [Paracoccus aestuariivivens]
MKTALAIRHVHFEDLGSFAAPLAEHGYNLRYTTVGDAGFPDFDPLGPDLLIVLGGPVGVYETSAYPFLIDERDRIAARLAQDLPTLGICLGAQLIAAALGSRVFPAGLREIGFAPVRLTEAGRAGPLCHLEDVPVLHWHGDTYDLPDGAVNLASTVQVRQQAFALGPRILGLQFHPEAETGQSFERWLVGHAHEIASAGIDPAALRADATRHGGALTDAARRMFAQWLDDLAT